MKWHISSLGGTKIPAFPFNCIIAVLWFPLTKVNCLVVAFYPCLLCIAGGWYWRTPLWHTCVPRMALSVMYYWWTKTLRSNVACSRQEYATACSYQTTQGDPSSLYKFRLLETIICVKVKLIDLLLAIGLPLFSQSWGRKTYEYEIYGSNEESECRYLKADSLKMETITLYARITSKWF